MKGFSAILALVLIAAVGIAAVALSGGNTFSIAGFSTLSLSNIDYVSNDPEIGGEAWNLLVALSGAGESAQGTFTASQIQDTTDGVKAASDFTLTTQVTANRIEYTIQNDFDQFYDVQYSAKGASIIDIAAVENDCKSNPNFLVFKSVLTTPFGGDTVCFVKQPIGQKGIIRDDFKRIFAADITTTKSGVPTTARINTIDSSSVRLGDFGLARWEGFLATDVNEPTPRGQDVCALYVGSGSVSIPGNGWKLIDCSDYESLWKPSATATSIQACLAQTGSLTDVASRCRQSVNNNAALVLQGKQFTAIGGSGTTFSGVASGLPESGKVILDLPRQFTIPLLTIKLKTSYIGKLSINAPVGKPDIVSASSDEFQSANTGKGFIRVTVKNIGSGAGTFDVSAICPSPFSSNDRIRTAQLQPGETDIVFLTLTASVNQPASSTCTAKAYDIGNPSNYDTADVTVRATNIQICNAGTKKVEGRYILQCNSFGSGFEIVKQCTEDEIADPVTFTCIKADPKDQCGFLGLGCLFGGLGSLFAGVFGAIILALFIILAIVVIVVIYKAYRWARG